MLRKSINLLILGGFLSCLALPSMAARASEEKMFSFDGVELLLPRDPYTSTYQTRFDFPSEAIPESMLDQPDHVTWNATGAQTYPGVRIEHRIGYDANGLGVAAPAHLTIASQGGTLGYAVQFNNQRWRIPYGPDARFCASAILERIDDRSITHAQKMKISRHIAGFFQEPQQRPGVILDIAIRTPSRVN